MSGDVTDGRVTPAFTTGGGGFAFEDRVGTWAACALLAGEELGTLGVPSTIAFQEKSPKTSLDDVVVSVAGGSTAFLSVKSFDLMQRGFSDFVASAWQLLLSEAFDEGRDYVGFVVGEIRDFEWNSLQELIATSRLDVEERMARRIQLAGNFNQTDRDLWNSLAVPAELAESHDVNPETSPWRLLQRLEAFHCDFRASNSRSRAETLRWCSDALRDGSDATDLHEAVLELVSRARPAGGSVDWPRLQRHLGARFLLSARPDVALDWERLAVHTASRTRAVSDALDGVRLPRVEAMRQMRALDGQPFSYLAGPSGCGKTVLAKRWLKASAGGSLWLDARDINGGTIEFATLARLRVPLADVLGLGVAPVRVVIDGLDRPLEAGHAHAATAELARLAADSEGAIELLVTSQTGALEQLSYRVLLADGPAATTVIVDDLDDDDVELALSERPQLQRLAFQGELNAILRRPKILQVITLALRTVTDGGLGALESEADIAEIWWKRLALGDGGSRTERGEFLRGLAKWTAAQFSSLPAGGLAAAGIGDYAVVADGLRRDEILAVEEDAFAFEHDLFGDWTRFQMLGVGTNALSQIVKLEALPSWHRAIRVHALRTLSRGGAEKWLADHAALRSSGNDVAADIYLDAVLFSDDSQAIVATLWSDLAAKEGGRLLVRLLKRFLHSATVPDPRGAMIGSGREPQVAIHLAATWRMPIWVLWPPMLSVLSRHVDEAVLFSPLEVAEIATLWLRLAPAGSAGRAEAAQLAFALGPIADRGSHSPTDEQKLWEAFLAAGADDPERVRVSAEQMFGEEQADEWQ